MVKNKKFTPAKDWVWYAPNTTDAFGNQEIQAVVKALKAGWLTTGKLTQEFENKIAGLFGKKFALFVNSGSSANLLALEIMKFPKGSEIITPACNFNTTVSPIVRLGLIPVFVDVSLGTYTIDVNSLEKALSKKTVAIMAPHLIGNFVDLPKIQSFCKKHNLVFIEDSCDTIGGSFHGKPSGIWSDITTTSFYASHIITAAGAGGMLMLNDKELREKARIFRDWGRGISRHDEKIRSRLATFKIDGKPYDSAFVFIEQGYNFRPTELQAAFGLQQLNRLDNFIKVRSHNFIRLLEFFKQFEEYFILPQEIPNTKTNWLAFPLTIRKSAPFERNTLVRYLEDHKIQTRPLF
jgi:CDP-6-deoxy-D-xylo-4-hexulose-3-dehydrase